MKTIGIICIYFFLSFIFLFGETSDSLNLPDKWSFENMFSELISYHKEIKLQNFIISTYGIGAPDFVKTKATEKFANVYPFSFRYGFVRINKKFTSADKIYCASEYVGFENISSHFKPKDWLKEGNTIDVWRFFGGYTNGLGYLFGDRILSLNHSSFIGWTHNDIELHSLNPKNEEVLKQYDDKYKFSTGFEASVNYEIISNLLIKAAFSRSIINPELKFFQWMPGVTLELLLQRAIDMFAKNMLGQSGDIYPFINFIVKNSISFGLYELRRHNMYFPLSSDSPLNIQNFSVGIGLIF